MSVVGSIRIARSKFANVGNDVVELLPRMPYDVSYTPAGPVIGFAFEVQAGTHRFGSDRRTPFRTRPNSLSYIPAGCDVASCSDSGGEYLIVRSPDSPERHEA